MPTTDDLVKLVEVEVAKFRAEISSLNEQLDRKDRKDRKLKEIHEITQGTDVPMWDRLQNIAATAASALEV